MDLGNIQDVSRKMDPTEHLNTAHYYSYLWK